MNLITTVIVEPESTDMTVVETVKQELQKKDDADDERIGRYIRQASGIIVRYCNREFAKATVTDSFRLPPLEGPLFLSRTPVDSVTPIGIVEAGAELGVSDWQLDFNSGQLWRLDSNGERTSWAPGRIDITYAGGYEMITDLPEDLEQACISIVSGLFFRAGRDPLVRQESVPGVGDFSYWIGGVGDNGALLPEVVALLDPFRRFSV